MNTTISSMVLAFMLLSCSSPGSGTTETAAQDSATFSDSASTESLPVPETATTTTTSQDTSQLNNQYNEQRDAVLNETDVYYQVSVSTKQYEATSDVTWYFDSSFAPRYFSLSWSAEGSDGSTELVIGGGEVICGQVEELSSTDRWCAATGGTHTVWNEETGESEISLLVPDYGNDLNTQLSQHLETLKQILHDSERSAEDEHIYMIKSEHTIDVGFEYVETVETRIPKELYDELMR